MKNVKVVMMLAPLVILSPLAVASPDGLDLTFDMGSARQKGNQFSDSDSSVGLKLGYDLTSNWSLSLSYTDFGKAQLPTGTLVIEDGSFFDFYSFIETKGIGLSAQYLTDPVLAGWSFGGRVGVMQLDTKVSSYAPDYQDASFINPQDSAASLTLGLLASYALTEQLKLVISADYMEPEIQRYTFSSSEDIKITRYALGLNYHF